MQKVAKQSLWPEVILESKLIDKETYQKSTCIVCA